MSKPQFAPQSAIAPTYVAHSRALPAELTAGLHLRLEAFSPKLVLESLSVSDSYGRLSLAAVQPTLELWGQADTCHIRLLDARAKPWFDALREAFADASQPNSNASVLYLQLPRQPFLGRESERWTQTNAASPIRWLLRQAAPSFPQKSFLGLYGAFGYYFPYLYEDLPRPEDADGADFHLFLYDTFVLVNHLTGTAEALAYRNTEAEAQTATAALAQHLADTPAAEPDAPQLLDRQMTPDETEFCALVGQARDLCAQGELMEIVLARQLRGTLVGTPLGLYHAYRSLNPAPYLFYLDLGQHDGPTEYLVGASPEMMLRAEHGQVQLRPISGTAPRGQNPIDDHEIMLQLLMSEKEKSELDMLVDLGRNDLARVCQPGVWVDRYRYVERYSRVMHTVAQVSGTLAPGLTGYEALLAALPAGTLSGAPKLAAMRYIDALEPFRRGWYGGAVGYLLLSGEVDTGIVIRTAHIRGHELRYCSGATLLFDSLPEAELRETQHKAAAFLGAFAPLEA